MEMRFGALPVAEHRGRGAQETVHRAVAGDEVPDHHIGPSRRGELGVERLGHLLVAERRARVREVDE